MLKQYKMVTVLLIKYDFKQELFVFFAQSYKKL